jgi:hypothetical protein
VSEEFFCVKCVGCDREAQCLRMKDGRVFRPSAWRYRDDVPPLYGLCPTCQAADKVWSEGFLFPLSNAEILDL